MLSPGGRVVLVSGASRGIGAAIARHLLELGYRVSLGARRPETLGEVSGGAPADRVHHARFEALDAASHAAWVDDVLARFGRIDGLVNNAGVLPPGTIETVDDATLDLAWAVNVKAPLSLMRLALPALRRSGTGRIVNVASLSGKRVRNDLVAYNLSKFALVALSQSARRLAWNDGVRVTALCPGFTRTDLTADVTSVATTEMTAPEDLAVLVAMVLALPNEAAIAELHVNCRFEDRF